MIRTFTRIRKKLLGENRLTKYLLYAFGEIVLVVLGILIALQINAWNKEKQSRELEIKILKEINSNLNFDLSEIEFDVALMDSIDKSCGSALHEIENLSSPSKYFGYDLTKIKATPHFDPNRSGYELLVSKGVELIRSDSLRKEISIHYETKYPYYAKYENERIDFVKQNYEEYSMKYVSYFGDTSFFFYATGVVSQEDYNAIREDSFFKKKIQGVRLENSFVSIRARETSVRIQNLIAIIDQELDKLEG